MPADKDTALGRLAVERGYLTQAQLDETLALQHKMHDEFGMDQSLEQILVSKHLLSQDQAQELRHAAAIQTGEARLVAGYEVISKLGQGGMGAVYKAKHPTSGQFVALKILPPSLATDELVRRFRREAEIVRKLDHENIVACTEFGFDKRRKVHFCALELVEGEDLAKRITRLGRLTEGEALSITSQVAMALQHAFFNGLVHRDVKPENIMVTADGTVKLLDLGLARPANQEATRLTESGMFVGSPYYASPEQALGQREVDTRSDIYSLGATLYHMVTGKPPFEGTTALAILQKHVNEKLPWPAEVNPDLSDGLCMIIAKMMEKSPEDRYQTPNDLNRDLDALMEGNEPEAGDAALKNSSVKVPAVRPGRRRRAAARERHVKHAEHRRRDSVRDARRARPERRTGRSAVPAGLKIAIGAGVVGLVVIGLIIYLGGREPDRRPPKRGDSEDASRTQPDKVTPESVPPGADRPTAEARKVSPPERAAADAGKAEPPKALTLDLGGGVTMEMIYIRPGVFMMGGSEEPRHAAEGVEKPKHEVEITRGFYMARYEVTRGQFAAFVKATGYRTEAEKGGSAWAWHPDRKWRDTKGVNWLNPMFFTQTDDHPVTCVSWNDAKVFCDWVSTKTRRDVRLPSEAEWEYACRAGTTTRFSFGDHEAASGDYAWYTRNSKWRTHPVGQKKPNAWGLCDMHGNVSELVADWYDANYYATSPRENPTGPQTGRKCIVRGGGWLDGGHQYTSAHRHLGDPFGRAHNSGFRAAVSTSPPGPRPAERARNVPADAVEFGGHWYKLYKQKMTWHDANAYCEKQGGHLATITSKDENDLISGLARKAGRDSWIGIFEERRNQWLWITGEALVFSGWQRWEPSHPGRPENRGAINSNQDWRWGDSTANAEMSLVCEWEPGWKPASTPLAAKAPSAPKPYPGEPDKLRIGLVGHWTFDEGEGTTAGDSSGKGNHGKIIGGPQWTKGRLSGALELDGKDDYVCATGFKGVTGTVARTVAAWIRTTDQVGVITAWGKSVPGKAYVFRTQKADGPTGTIGVWVKWGHVVGSTDVTDGEWHHVAVTWSDDGTPGVLDHILYVDGARDATDDKGGRPMNTLAASDLRIGSDLEGVKILRNFTGLMDDVRIYNRALSAEEIRLLAHPEEWAKATPPAPSAAKALDALLTAFDSLMAKGDHTAAREWAEKAAGAPANAGAKEVLEAAARVARVMAGEPAATIRGAKTLVGREVRLKLARGSMTATVKAASDTGLAVATKFTINNQTRERRRSLKWDALHAEQKAELARLGGWNAPSADRAIVHAYAALASGDVDAAEAAVREAGSHPLAEHLKARLAKAKAEAAYTTAMARARARMRMKNWKGAVESFEKALAAIPEDTEATKLLAEAESHIVPTPTLTLELAPGVTMEFVYIKPGVFVMGGDENPREGWQGVEKPKHEVAITQGFYIGKYEVTQAQYEAVTGKNPSKWKEPNRPVEHVTWHEAVEFCRLATEGTRKQFRLPTEAEWEYACRAGSTGKWCFGSDEGGLGEYAWYGGNSGGQTHPVGQKKPNQWGLYDVHGNVWEWVADWYAADYYAKSPRENPTGPGAGSRRLLRGGSWASGGSFWRSAFRRRFAPSLRNRDHGFRAVVSARRMSASAQAAYERAMSRAKMRVRVKDWKGAAEACEEALKHKPGDAEAEKLLAEAQSHIGPEPTLTLDLGNNVTMEFVYIKPGVFIMGGTVDVAPNHSWQGIEKPKHEVAITQGFYVGKYEVTQAQYQAVMGGNPSKWKEPNRPVEQVTWHKAVEFCQLATERTRRQVRLPREAEWEYACRAGSVTRYCFGSDETGLGDYAWYKSNSGGQTHPVGQKKTNQWGLYDVHGNVWEWVADWYATDYYAKSPRENPTGPDAGNRRLLRGGSWNNDGTNCRSAIRHLHPPSFRIYHRGFRAVVSVSPPRR